MTQEHPLNSFLQRKNASKEIGKKSIAAIASIVTVSLLLSVYQPSDAQVYSGHDGSIDEHMTKVVVEPLRGKNGLWNYLVKICADDDRLAISSVIMKSDLEQKVLGFNKTLREGDCTYASATLKTKDSNTLGAELIERHEAIERMKELSQSISDMTAKEKQSTIKEIVQLYMSTGFMPRF